jgi:hypothetical protein
MKTIVILQEHLDFQSRNFLVPTFSTIVFRGPEIIEVEPVGWDQPAIIFEPSDVGEQSLLAFSLAWAFGIE